LLVLLHTDAVVALLVILHAVLVLVHSRPDVVVHCSSVLGGQQLLR
jgi:hypothetical protein